MEATEQDIRMMQRAFDLAEQGSGYVAPNPLVGCVITSNTGEIIGTGYHEKYGQPHAEVNAVNSVKNKEDLIDATVYVTLEPCAHHGKTPPCAQLLADLPVSKVVYAIGDPNPEVNGKGADILKKAGKEVVGGVMDYKAKQQNEFFFHHINSEKPFVTLKLAQTLDGYLAAPDGDSKWITSEISRKKVHEWRKSYDAVMIGRNTALLDNPKLTVRHVEGRHPQRIVIDGDFSLPGHLNLFSDQYEEKTIIITHNKKRADEIADPMLQLLQSDYFRGKVVTVGKHKGHSDLREALIKLGRMNITSILVEAGSELTSALLSQNLVDKIHIFIAPKLLGGGTRSVTNLGINRMNEILQFRDSSWEQSGNDLLFTGYF